MFTLKANYPGHSGGTLWLSYSGDNYVILYDDSAVHMILDSQNYLTASSDNFPAAVNPKAIAEYGDRASWRDTAFNMTGHPVVFTDDGQIAQKDNLERRLCLHGDDGRRVYWSVSSNDPDTSYLTFEKVPYS